MDSVVVEIHSEIYVGDTLYRIEEDIIADNYFGEWWRRALKGNMLHIDRNAGIYPSGIDEPIVGEGNIAVVLRVDHRSVSTNIEAREYIIVPYLIISNETFSVERAL